MSDLYSRNYSGRGGGKGQPIGRAHKTDQNEIRQSQGAGMPSRPVPPPAYSGTLYISARSDRTEKEGRVAEPTVSAQTRRVDIADPLDGVRTVRYNGGPLFPNDMGLYGGDSGRNQASDSDDREGKGGHPDLGGGDALRFRRRSRGPVVGDRTDIDYYGTPDDAPAFHLFGEGFPFAMPSSEDIILIALIITLISARANNDFDDDILIIILGILLLTGLRDS